jgi:hypothetical protein
MNDAAFLLAGHIAHDGDHITSDDPILQAGVGDATWTSLAAHVEEVDA